MTSDLEPRVAKLEVDMEELKQVVVQNNRQIGELSVSLARLDARIDEFVFQAQRLLTGQAERLERVEGQAERADAIITRLDRNYEAQQSQLAEFRITTNAALERIDRVLDYLMRQQGNSNG